MNKKIKKGDYLDTLLRSKKTVFSTKDITLLWGDPNPAAARVRLNYYLKKKKLMHILHGLYSKDENYNKYELSNKILSPSYVSFETVLGASGITFQYYGQIFAASHMKKDIICDGQEYSFRTIKRSVLINPIGVDQSEEYSIATKERAFLDTIYRSKDYHFDNLSPLDWDKVFEILPIYGNKRMEKKARKYFEYYQSVK